MERASAWLKSAVGLAAVLRDGSEADLPRRLGSCARELLPVDSASVLLVGEGAFDGPGCDGPAFECLRTGRPLAGIDLRQKGPWPEFAARALAEGYVAAAVLPLGRGGEGPVGVLQLLSSDAALSEAGLAGLQPVQELGDLFALLLGHARTLRETRRTVDQLSGALDSRVLIEQAKGMLAERWRVTPTEAFRVLRAHARTHRMKLRDVAASVVDGTLLLEAGVDARSGGRS
ncbi:ANTAR domain-containing protein [Streptomyces sp. NPDC051907]|uniref:ANTAR domain-containing protein n=1 Tax=Streptomyces sp. NPDC051907 TaxID=3155284 RepID=UPI003438DE74